MQYLCARANFLFIKDAAKDLHPVVVLSVSYLTLSYWYFNLCYTSGRELFRLFINTDIMGTRGVTPILF